MNTEIRIGNIVGTYEPHRVNGIYLSHFTAVNKNGVEHNSVQYNLSPILLTPEILGKAGFKYYKKDCEYSLGDFKIIHWNQNGYLLSSYEPIEIWESPKMEIFNTVHDLQNIYYAHKKKELKIEL